LLHRYGAKGHSPFTIGVEGLSFLKLPFRLLLLLQQKEEDIIKKENDAKKNKGKKKVPTLGIHNSSVSIIM
jgi:hypothetical protein